MIRYITIHSINISSLRAASIKLVLVTTFLSFISICLPCTSHAQEKKVRYLRNCINDVRAEIIDEIEETDPELNPELIRRLCQKIGRVASNSFELSGKPESLVGINNSFEFLPDSDYLFGWFALPRNSVSKLRSTSAPDGEQVLAISSKNSIALAYQPLKNNEDSGELEIKFYARRRPSPEAAENEPIVALFATHKIRRGQSQRTRLVRIFSFEENQTEENQTWKKFETTYLARKGDFVLSFLFLGAGEDIEFDNLTVRKKQDNPPTDPSPQPSESVSPTPHNNNPPASASPSVSVTSSADPSSSPAESPSTTPSRAPSSSASNSPSSTPSPSASQSPSATRTPSPSASNSASSSPSISPSASPSGLPPVEGCDGATGTIVNLDSAWFAGRTAPYYLDQPNTTYRLKTHVNTLGSAFALIANNISLDLCGNTVTYDNSPAINIPNWDFEIASPSNPTKPDRWDTSAAPNAVLANAQNISPQSNLIGKVLRINFPAPAQDIISESFTLAPNTTYSISAVPNKQTGSGDVYLALQGTANKLKLTERNVVQYFKYTTGPVAETHRIGIQVRAGDSATSLSTVDKITIQKEAAIGAIVGPASWNMPNFYNGFTRFGDSANSKIKNGSIIQGTDNGTRAFPIFLQSDGSILSNLTLRSRGVDTASIYSYYSDFTMHGSTIYNDMQLTTDRHQFRGYVIQGYPTVQFYNNTIIGGPQGGVLMGVNSNVYNNTISLRDRFTNGFAVMSWGAKNSNIYNNSIDCSSSDYSCRGLAIHNDNANTKVYGNNVSIRGLKRNDEYNGCQLGGMYGIQIEGDTTGIPEIFNNTIEAIGSECDASAFRYNGDTRKGDNVHDNTFIAKKVATGDLLVVATNLGNVNDTVSPSITFHNNTLRSNMGWFKGLIVTNFKMTNTRLEVIEDGYTMPFRFYNDSYDPSGYFVQGVWGLKFVDSTFGSTRARSEFEAQAIRRWWQYDRGWRHESWLHAFYTTTIKVKNSANAPVSGANVSVLDKDGNVVAVGITDANGEFKPEIRHFMTKTTSAGAVVHTDYNLHSIQASSGASSGSASNVNVNAVQTVNITLN